MHHIALGTIIFLVISGFLASFVDSTVGGGGLISLPALLLTGLPPAVAIGTNKLGGTASALTSTLSFLKSKKVHLHLVKYLIPLSLVGSVGGAELVHYLPTGFLRPMVIVMLIGVTAYTVFKPNVGLASTYSGMTRKVGVIVVSVALIIGFYDGFFGPGTGAFLVFAFIFTGFDFVEASGNAKVLNFASNIGALVTFAGLRTINYEYGIVMAVSMMAGAVVGSQLAIRKGARYVRPIFIAVTLLLISRQLWGLL
ncbi:TSUP family transporter [Alicyclobacillus sp. SO9]|uniref:TSUP family transporter n=1 Tax=Alicyclobacillus sp. SO9 TaxID=2665646 RepID=UPI0018E88435|nr:TSUP family transporter [Alicyclobacillus sp. SO9]QQE78153.1 TSUP family transporter [Alicyclobacillus sp. SO9]